MFSFEKIDTHQKEKPYETNLDENFQKMTLNNLYYPGSVVPLMEYADDIWNKLPKMIGDEGRSLEVSTLENKNGIAVEITGTVKKNKIISINKLILNIVKFTFFFSSLSLSLSLN